MTTRTSIRLSFIGRCLIMLLLATLSACASLKDKAVTTSHISKYYRVQLLVPLGYNINYAISEIYSLIPGLQIISGPFVLNDIDDQTFIVRVQNEQQLEFFKNNAMSIGLIISKITVQDN